MKQGSHTTLDNGIQQQKSLIDASKVVAKNVKSNGNVKSVTPVNLVDDKININGNNDDNDKVNDDNINSLKKISEVQPTNITNETENKSVVTDQNFVDSNDNDNSKSNNSNDINNNDDINNNNNNNNSNNNNGSDNNKESEDKELLSKLSQTLAEFYGGGNGYDGVEEPQKKKQRSSVKVSNTTKKEGEKGEAKEGNKNSEIKIRDFAFPTDDPRHWGQVIYEEEIDDDEYVNRHARALYDFPAESSSELSFQEGDILFIECRQYDGWLMASLGEESGLIPENYVKILDDDEDDEDEYGNWAEEAEEEKNYE